MIGGRYVGRYTICRQYNATTMKILSTYVVHVVWKVRLYGKEIRMKYLHNGIGTGIILFLLYILPTC